MQEAILQNRTTIREKSSKIEESEGHFVSLRPLLLHGKEHLPSQKGLTY